MTMEGLINTFWEIFYPITDASAARVLQHVLRDLSLGKRISHMIVHMILATSVANQSLRAKRLWVDDM